MENKLELGQEIEKIKIIETEKEKKVLVMGKIYMSWQKTDEVATKVAIAQLYETGLAKQEDLARIFKMHINSIYNYITDYKESGIKGLIEQTKGPRESWKMTPELRGEILVSVLKEGKKEYRKIQELVEKRIKKKISIESIRQVLMENGLVEEKIKTDGLEQLEIFSDKTGQQELFFNYSEDKEIKNDKEGKYDNNLENNKFTEEDIENIVEKRNWLSTYTIAERKYLDNLFRGEYNAYAGGLLFTTLLKKTNYISVIRRIIATKEENDYDIGHISQTLFYYDLFGFNSIENFSHAYPEEFGVLIGKANSPSVFTIRRYLQKIRKLKKGEELMEEFAKEYLRQGIIKWGELYVDGHFMPYYGIAAITMGWHGVMQKAMKGSNNFLGVDWKYNPWIFFIRPSSEDLLEIIPEIIQRAKKIGRELEIKEEEINRLTIIFDREGYSAELFRLLEEREDMNIKAENKGTYKANFISWAKNADDWLNKMKEEEFNKKTEIKYELQKEEEIKYFDTERVMNKYGKIRALAIQSGRKKQRAAIYTNDRESSAERIIHLMCRRWGEENLNKDFKLNHYLDYYPGKGLWEKEELKEQPMIDNPALEELKKEKTILVSKINKLKIEIADKLLKRPEEKTNWDTLKKEKKLELLTKIVGLESQITLIKEKMSQLPKEVKYDQVHIGEKIYDLDYEKKRFLDCIKVFTYTMRKQMLKILLKYYNNPKDIGSVLDMIIHRSAYIKLRNWELTIRFKRFKNQEVDFAARHLCEEINLTKPKTLDKFGFSIHFEVE